MISSHLLASVQTNRFQQAFTLIELIIVMLLISILSIMAIGNWPSQEINVNAQAEQFAADIRFIQNYALHSGQGAYLTLNTTSSPNQYSLTSTTGATIIHPATNNTVIKLNNNIAFGKLTNLANKLIAFNSQGRPYTDSGLTTALVSNAVITLTSQAQTSTITISPQTGRVFVQ